MRSSNKIAKDVVMAENHNSIKEDTKQKEPLKGELKSSNKERNSSSNKYKGNTHIKTSLSSNKRDSRVKREPTDLRIKKVDDDSKEEVKGSNKSKTKDKISKNIKEHINKEAKADKMSMQRKRSSRALDILSKDIQLTNVKFDSKPIKSKVEQKEKPKKIKDIHMKSVSAPKAISSKKSVSKVNRKIKKPQRGKSFQKKTEVKLIPKPETKVTRSKSKVKEISVSISEPKEKGKKASIEETKKSTQKFKPIKDISVKRESIIKEKKKQKRENEKKEQKKLREKSSKEAKETKEDKLLKDVIMNIKTCEIKQFKKNKHTGKVISINNEKKTNKAKYNRELNSLKELWRDKRVKPINEKKHNAQINNAKETKSNKKDKTSKIENYAQKEVKSKINVETKRRVKSLKPPKTKEILKESIFISSVRQLRHAKVDSEKERKSKKNLKGLKAKRESKYNEKQKEIKRSHLAKRASSVVKISKGIKSMTKIEDKPKKSIVKTPEIKQSKRDKIVKNREKSSKKDIVIKIEKKENT